MDVVPHEKGRSRRTGSTYKIPYYLKVKFNVTSDPLGQLNSLGSVIEGLHVVLSQLAEAVDTNELHVHHFFPKINNT